MVELREDGTFTLEGKTYKAVPLQKDDPICRNCYFFDKPEDCVLTPDCVGINWAPTDE